jgi:fatty acid amide hydrolase
MFTNFLSLSLLLSLCPLDMNAFMKGVNEEWEEQGLSGLIMPTTGLVATPHGQASELIFQLSYTFYANLLHVPAGTVPVTLVQSGEDNYDLSKLPTRQRDSVARLADGAMQGSLGMPVGVQVVTKMWRDELCVYLMGCIEKGVQFKEVCPAMKNKC